MNASRTLFSIQELLLIVNKMCLSLFQRAHLTKPKIEIYIILLVILSLCYLFTATPNNIIKLITGAVGVVVKGTIGIPINMQRKM